jgi:hypothetical protein
MRNSELALAVAFAGFVAYLPAHADTTQRQQDYHKCMEDEDKKGWSLPVKRKDCCEKVGGTWVEIESGPSTIADSGCTVSDEAMPVSPTDPRKKKSPLRSTVGPLPETTDPGVTSTEPVDPALRYKVVPSATTETP